MPSFSIKEAFSFGWKVFWSRPWMFAGAILIGFILNASTALLGPNVLSSLASFIISILYSMGITAFVLKAYDDTPGLQIRDLWHPTPFFKYLGTILIVVVLTAIGFILLVVPGVILSVMFVFANYTVIDKAYGPIEALKESMRITKNRRWKLFLFLLATVGVNVLGAIALGIGLLISIPVSLLATAYLYRFLQTEVAAVRTSLGSGHE